MGEYNFKNLMRRLARAGFKKRFVESVILPDWWNPACGDDPDILPDVEIRVARFLGIGVSDLRSSRTLQAPAYDAARLRQVRGIERARIEPAIHAAVQVAGAVVRALREEAPASRVPPSDGLEWRQALRVPKPPVKLEHLVDDLWERGIPVIPLDVLPSPSFQGLACIVSGRPVIVLGHRHDEPGRVAFFVAHEAGHVAAGDCAPGRPVVDEQEEKPIADEGREQRADDYAARVLTGGAEIPAIEGADFLELAKAAASAEREHGIDAGTVVYAWARQTGEYAVARQAVNALYKATGARQLLRQRLEQWVNPEAASDTDRALLNSVFGGTAVDASSR